MNSNKKMIPDWKLEQLLLGELPEAEATALRAALEAEPGGTERLAALEESNREILATYAPAEMVQEIQRRQHLDAVRREHAATEAPRWRKPLMLALPTAAAATLAVVLLQGPPATYIDPFPPEHTTIKGLDSRLYLHRQTAEGAEELRSGDSARAGDILQLAYNAAGKQHGLIVSLDGRGAVTVHLAGRGGLHSAPLEPSGKAKLDQAYELDDAPEFERFFFFVSDTPFETQPLLAAVKTAGEGEPAFALAGVEYLSFTVRKVAP